MFGRKAKRSRGCCFIALSLPAEAGGRGAAFPLGLARLAGRTSGRDSPLPGHPPSDRACEFPRTRLKPLPSLASLGRQYFYCLGDSHLQVPNILFPLAQLILGHSIRSAEDADTGRTTKLLSSICILTCCLRRRALARRRMSPPAGINAFPAGRNIVETLQANCR